MTCQACGAELPDGALFCPRCGAPVAGESSGEERKMVTVVFADVADSTQLATRLEAERLREVMGAFFAMASAEVASLRGRTEKFIGDAVVAVWGLPLAHDDDALRAVRAALLIRDRASRLAETLGFPVPLQIRVGVNSGSVATGPGPADQFMASGAAVNLAARLQQAAAPGEVLVGETTWALTRHAVEMGTRRIVSAKGFGDAIPAWPVVALSTRTSRRTIPLVGREHELTLLTDTFERVRMTGRAHLVTVLGEPGIGKSRLVDEFLARLPEDALVLSGRASDFEEEVTYAPLAEMIRRELGLGRDVGAGLIRKRLDEVVEECCDPADAEVVAARLGMALGLQAPGEQGHRFRAAEIAAGFLAYIEAKARTGPVVLVFEDLHLAREPMLDLIDKVVRRARRVPLTVVTVAREDLLEHRPTWGGGLPDVLTLRLEPLEPGEARELALAAGESLDELTAERVARHAGGNPFFIVETTGMLLHERDEEPPDLHVSRLFPPTVQAVVASRIDHLSEDARDVIRKASVFASGIFDERDLALVADPRPELIEELEEHELIVPDGSRAGAWRFRHEVLRDVAYETLTKRDRRRLHQQVADALVERGDADRAPRKLASHLERAAWAAFDLDPDDRAPAEAAVDALGRAADVARRGAKWRAAIDLYERALALAGPRTGWGAREARFLGAIGEARYWLGEFGSAEEALDEALALGGDDAWTRALAGRFRGDITLNIHGDLEAARSSFDDALAAARELDDPYAIARTLLMAGWVPYWEGDLARTRERFEEALAVARENPDGDPWAEARGLASLTSVISPTGDEEECLALGRRSLAVGEEMADPFTIAVAHEAVGNSLRRMGRLDEALTHLQAAVRVFTEVEARWELASALGDRGYVHRLHGRLDDAERDLRDALDICRDLHERAIVVWTVSELALILLLRGSVDEARRVLDEPLPETEEPGSDVSILRARALVTRLEGDEDGARKLAVEGLGLERARGRPNPVAADTWWVARLFGPEAAGGDEAVADAERRLGEVHWMQALHEPDQFVGLR